MYFDHHNRNNRILTIIILYRLSFIRVTWAAPRISRCAAGLQGFYLFIVLFYLLGHHVGPPSRCAAGLQRGHERGQCLLDGSGVRREESHGDSTV
jgi:hypothetical protein